MTDGEMIIGAITLINTLAVVSMWFSDKRTTKYDAIMNAVKSLDEKVDEEFKFVREEIAEVKERLIFIEACVFYRGTSDIPRPQSKELPIISKSLSRSQKASQRMKEYHAKKRQEESERNK